MVENFDGDEVRQNLYPDLGFSAGCWVLIDNRTAFLCKLLNRTGIAVVTGKITPFPNAQWKGSEIVD